MDPVTAIANAAGEGFKYMSKGLDVLFGNKQQRKLIQEQGKNLDKLTEQERIKYQQLIISGNNQLAAQMLLIASNRDDNGQLTNTLIVGGVVVAIILIIILKLKK